MSPSINDEHGGGAQPTPRDGFQVSAPAANFSGGDVFQRTDARIRYAARKFGEVADEISANRDFSDDGKQGTIASFANTEAARDADAALAEVEQHTAGRAVRVEAERAKLAPPLDAAGQVHAQRTWQRAERQLASAENVGQRAAIARQLIGSASPEELAVYAEEMPAEMSANGVPTSWINDELAKAAPEYGKARQELEDAERKLLKIRHNHRLTSE
jgi:hypothetical protein